MRHSHSVLLTNAQVARIEARRKALGLTMPALVEKFAAALKAHGCNQSTASAKMRLDRVLNPRMRKPVSEMTKAALAQALDWDVAELEAAIRESNHVRSKTVTSSKQAPQPKARSARQIAHCAAVQLETHQIARGVDLKRDNLLKVYSATHRMFLHIRELMEELPVEEFAQDPAAQRIYETLLRTLNESLRPHLTVWADRYQQWHLHFAEGSANELTTQQFQMRFPQTQQLQRELRRTGSELQRQAQQLKELISCGEADESSQGREAVRKLQS